MSLKSYQQVAAIHMLPLFSEAFFPLGSIPGVGGMLGNGTGKWRKRDLTFESRGQWYFHHLLYLEGFQEA